MRPEGVKSVRLSILSSLRNGKTKTKNNRHGIQGIEPCSVPNTPYDPGQVTLNSLLLSFLTCNKDETRLISKAFLASKML